VINAGTTLEAWLGGIRNEEAATPAAGDTSQHALLIVATKAAGVETIPVISADRSCIPIPAIPGSHEASAAAGSASITLIRAAATSLDPGVMCYEMIVPGHATEAQ
jgi:hypothetical protein